MEVQSRLGGECRVQNPWGEKEVELYRDKKKSGSARGPLVQFATGKGETIVIVPSGIIPAQLKREVTQ